MDAKRSLRKPEEVTPVFGLCYLEEEAELNGVNGCRACDQSPIDANPTYYTTSRDYPDYN